MIHKAILSDLITTKMWVLPLQIYLQHRIASWRVILSCFTQADFQLLITFCVGPQLQHRDDSWQQLLLDSRLQAAAPSPEAAPATEVQPGGRMRGGTRQTHHGLRQPSKRCTPAAGATLLPRLRWY